jgi:hypothetical protein
MKKVTLVFPAAFHLWDFVQVVNPVSLQIYLDQLLITCTCTDYNVQLGINKYGAKVVSGYSSSIQISV